MTRIMFPFLLLVALAAQAMGVLNACNRFGVPALASTFFNIGSVGFGVILGYVLGPRLGIEPHHRHGASAWCWAARCNCAGSCRAARLGFASVQRSTGAIPLLRKIFRLMGPGDSGQRGGADQRDGEHQLRLAHSRATAR